MRSLGQVAVDLAPECDHIALYLDTGLSEFCKNSGLHVSHHGPRLAWHHGLAS